MNTLLRLEVTRGMASKEETDSLRKRIDKHLEAARWKAFSDIEATFQLLDGEMTTDAAMAEQLKQIFAAAYLEDPNGKNMHVDYIFLRGAPEAKPSKHKAILPAQSPRG